MAAAVDLKSTAQLGVRVRVPSGARMKLQRYIRNPFICGPCGAKARWVNFWSVNNNGANSAAALVGQKLCTRCHHNRVKHSGTMTKYLWQDIYAPLIVPAMDEVANAVEIWLQQLCRYIQWCRDGYPIQEKWR